MLQFRIRQYRDSDYQAVRCLYVTGVQQHFGRVCCHVVKQPWIQGSLALSLSLVLILSRSLLLSVFLMLFLLTCGWLLLRHFWTRIIKLNLMQDLQDIRSFYMQQPDSCFWVAESSGLVVGTVGAAPSNISPTGLELKRMNVCEEFRGQGIAKALCLTVLDFAQCSHFTHIMLGTSVIQTEAQSLYHRMGYRLVDIVQLPHFLAKITNYTIYRYQYRVPANPDLHPQDNPLGENVTLCQDTKNYTTSKRKGRSVNSVNRVRK
ncbi:putative N-acetyltransferase camello [Mustelus asterias]